MKQKGKAGKPVVVVICELRSRCHQSQTRPIAHAVFRFMAQAPHTETVEGAEGKKGGEAEEITGWSWSWSQRDAGQIMEWPAGA